MKKNINLFVLICLVVISCVSKEKAREELAKKCAQAFPCVTTKQDTFLHIIEKKDTFYHEEKTTIRIPCPPSNTTDTITYDCPKTQKIIVTKLQVQERTITKYVEDSAKITLVRVIMRDTLKRINAKNTTIENELKKQKNINKMYSILLILLIIVVILLVIAYKKIKVR